MDGQFHEDTIEKRTGSLLDPKHGDFALAMRMPYSLDPDRAPSYLSVPYDLVQVQTRNHLPMWAWRVEFHSLAPGSSPMGLDILGPVILGRTSPQDTGVDVDFALYDALNRGVSRRHALIRPTEDRLYLIDLSSTNGTRRNEIPLGAGIAVSLENGDMISLGELSFEVRILSSPDRSLKRISDTRPMTRGAQ